MIELDRFHWVFVGDQKVLFQQDHSRLLPDVAVIAINDRIEFDDIALGIWNRHRMSNSVVVAVNYHRYS